MLIGCRLFAEVRRVVFDGCQGFVVCVIPESLFVFHFVPYFDITFSTPLCVFRWCAPVQSLLSFVLPEGWVALVPGLVLHLHRRLGQAPIVSVTDGTYLLLHPGTRPQGL